MKTEQWQTPHGEVMWAEVQPGDGYRYSGFVSLLPQDVEGGTVDGHVLVTLYSPFDRPIARVLSVDGYLTRWYVEEKFNVRPSVLDGVMQLLNVLLPERKVEGCD